MTLTKIPQTPLAYTIMVDDYVLDVDPVLDKEDNLRHFKFTTKKRSVGTYQHLALITRDDLTEGIIEAMKDIFNYLKNDEDRQKRRAGM